MKQMSMKSVLDIDVNKGGFYTFEDAHVSVYAWAKATTPTETGIRDVNRYPGNRGGFPLDYAHVKAISDNFKVSELGVVPIAKATEDGKWEDGTPYKKGDWFQFDAHNRTSAIHDRIDRGFMVQKELDSSILLRVIPWKDALDQYVSQNMTSPHTNKNKLLDGNLPAGSFLQEVLRAGGFEDMNPTWKMQVFRQCVYLTIGAANDSYHMVYREQDTATSMLNTLPRNVVGGKIIPGWNKSHHNTIAAGLMKLSYFYGPIDSFIPTELTSKNDDLKTLKNSSRLFAILLNYAISNDPQKKNIVGRLDELASTLIANPKTIKDAINDYTSKRKEKDKLILSLLTPPKTSRKKSFKAAKVSYKYKDASA